MKELNPTIKSESLQRAIKLLNVALTGTKTKQKAGKLLKEWPESHYLYEISVVLPSKLDREAKMEMLYKALIQCCLDHKICWDHMPSYSTCMKAWRKQFMQFRRDEKNPRGFLG